MAARLLQTVLKILKKVMARKYTDEEWAEKKRVSYEKRKARHRVWHARNKEHSVKQATRSSLMRKYQMTLEDYEIMLETRRGVCAICGSPLKADALCGS